jgi:hypothetical protein
MPISHLSASVNRRPKPNIGIEARLRSFGKKFVCECPRRRLDYRTGTNCQELAMSRLTAFSLQKAARPFEAILRHRRAAHASAQQTVQGEPEQLERIAAYARAGYFNMGYTFEMFPLVGDLPPY